MPTVYKACLSSYIVFGVMASAPMLICLASLVATGNPALWQPIAVCIAAWGFAVFWLSQFRLVIDPKCVEYKSLFSRRRKVDRAEIVFAGLAKDVKPSDGAAMFVIRSSSNIELRINLKVFSREAGRALFDLSPRRRKSQLS